LLDKPNDTHVSEHYDIVAAKGTSVRVGKKFLFGDTSMATFSVKFDLHHI
jgi:hypothetical protein